MRTLTFQQQNSPLVSRATAHLQTGHSRTEVPTVVTSTGTHYCPEHVPSRCPNQAGNTGRVGEEGNGDGLSGLPGTHPRDVGKCWWGCLVLLAVPFFHKDCLAENSRPLPWVKHNQCSFVLSKVGPYVSQGSRRKKKNLIMKLKNMSEMFPRLCSCPLLR